MAIEEVLRIIDQGSPALRSVAAEAVKADAALGKVEDGASNLGRASAQLRGSLSLLSPELGEAAGVANDLFDALEVGSQAAKGAGLSLGSIGAVAGPVAIAVAALAAVYVTLNGELQVSEANADAAAARASEMADTIDDWKAAVADLNVEFDVANGAMAAEDAAAAKRIARLREQRAGTEALLKAEYDRASAATAAADATLADSAAAVQARERLAAYQQGTEDLATKIELLTDKQKLEKAATDAATASAKSKAAADRAAALAATQRAKAMAADEAEIRANLARREEDRQQEAAAAAMRWEVEAQAAEEQIRLTEELAQAERDRADAAAANRDSAIRSTTAGVTGGPQAGLAGLSQAGPWGELIAGIVSLIGDLGDTLGSFQDYHNELKDAIATLPETLATNMESIFSDSFATVIPDFITSLMDNLDEIIGGIIEGVVSSTTALIEALVIAMPMAAFEFVGAMVDLDFWYEIGAKIVEGFIQGFVGNGVTGKDGEVTAGSFFAGLGDFLSGGLVGNITKASETGKLGSFDVGSSYVGRTGLYELHAGEEVINPTGMGTARQEAARGRASSARVGRGPRGVRIIAEVDIDDSQLETALQDARGRGYGV
jgi:chemotaxis protein histidine kinase CheA